MADETKDTPATGDNTKPATGSGELGDAGKRALQAEREKARKAEADLKAARDELARVKSDQDAKKTEIQKVLEKLAAMEQRTEQAERKALLAEVAQSKGLTPKQARRLQGATREELEADADELLADFNLAGHANQGDGAAGGGTGGGGGDQGDAGKPRPRHVREGSGAVRAGDEADYDKLAEQVLGG